MSKYPEACRGEKATSVRLLASIIIILLRNPYRILSLTDVSAQIRDIKDALHETGLRNHLSIIIKTPEF
jgi:hypothetical protein